MKLIRVSKCGECPYSREDYATEHIFYCSHCDGNYGIVWSDAETMPPIPDWCSLEDEKEQA